MLIIIDVSVVVARIRRCSSVLTSEFSTDRCVCCPDVTSLRHFFTSAADVNAADDDDDERFVTSRVDNA